MAVSKAIWPPCEFPTSTARPIPRLSMTAMTSARLENGTSSVSLRPNPRRSNRITR